MQGRVDPNLNDEYRRLVCQAIGFDLFVAYACITVAVPLAGP